MNKPKRRVKRVFACGYCGARFNEPTGIHLPGGAESGNAWCPVNAREVPPRRRTKR